MLAYLASKWIWTVALVHLGYIVKLDGTEMRYESCV